MYVEVVRLTTALNKVSAASASGIFDKKFGGIGDKHLIKNSNLNQFSREDQILT